MLLHCFHEDGLSINTYLVGDEHTKKAALIDPTINCDPYLQFAKEKGFVISDILETHVHADFVSGSKELKQRLNGKPSVHCSALGGKEWIPSYADQPFGAEHVVDLGTVRLQPLHTPGHTPEHVIWLCFDKERSDEVPCLAFTGDLLFVGGVGRPDLLGKEEEAALAERLYYSLFVELAKLPDFLEIFPAHGAGSLCGKGLSSRFSSTLGYERRFNLFLIQDSKDKWVKKIIEDIPAPPMNFFRLKKMNLHNTPQEKGKEPFLIDLRAPLQFSKSHTKGAVNIPYGSSFANWAASIIPPDASLIVVGENEHQLSEAMRNLKLIGFDTIEKTLVWSEPEPHEVLPVVDAAGLYKKMEEGSPLFILDVRTPAEWNGGHIEGAHHVELAQLPDQLNKIPRDSQVLAICGSGYRSSIAASFLKHKGYPNVFSVWGGMSSWKNSGFPTL